MSLACRIHGARGLRLEADATGELGRVDARPLISAQLPFSQAAQAFALAADRSLSTKVQLVPDPA